ncbi:Lrp/AsnC family transcriptional regulator [Clavibacter zhangzhiyongii]|uniref:Lrp/AsnC family transcriptional regulator n=1 Tax=Clavibacter zhangzhiyongii TaxID=2768071 RepID=UPI0039E09CC6
MRRLTEGGIITGYSITVDPEALGWAVTAFVRLAYPSGDYRPFHALVAELPEIVEAHHVTGADCFIVKVHARSMRDLERITGRLAVLGGITTTSCTRARSRGGTSGRRDPRPGRPTSPSRRGLVLLRRSGTSGRARRVLVTLPIPSGLGNITNVRDATDNPFSPGSDTVPEIWAGRTEQLSDWRDVVRPRLLRGLPERGRTVLGEPGLGKSSLVRRIAQTAAREGTGSRRSSASPSAPIR